MHDDIRQWVEALRSGNYKQGKHALCNPNNEMCCLGVYADVQKLGEIKKAWTDNDHDPDEDSTFNSYMYARLRYALDDLVDIDELIEMNDSGSTFEEIADRIEEMVNA